MKSRWLFRLYNCLVLIALPFILVGVAIRWRKRFARGLDRSAERWGKLSSDVLKRLSPGSHWWVHAVSLGEVKAIEIFLKEIPKQAGVKVFLTLVTPEALAWADEKQLADIIVAAPVDLPWVVRRVFTAVKPKIFISVESEFWPNLLRQAKRSGARVALVNGRISERSYESYKSIKSILSVLWECFDLIAVRQHEDASRFTDLGVAQKLIHVTGNLKFDLPLPAAADRQQSGQPSSLTIVVGSSREGEEKLLLPVIEKIRKSFASLQVIWAPRHIDRSGEIEAVFAEARLPLSRKSKGPQGPTPNLLWDSFGDLLEAYKKADVVIMGGSFVPKGGQNPLEPAAMGVPVIFGPSMENFLGISDVLVQQGGARQVTLADLEVNLKELLESPERRQVMAGKARQAVESRQGASDKTLNLLKGLTRA